MIRNPWALTGALALACLGGIALHREQVFPGAGGWVLGVSIAVGVLALMAAVHCSRGVYARWLAFSERLHTGVVTALFGAPQDRVGSRRRRVAAERRSFLTDAGEWDRPSTPLRVSRPGPHR